MVNKTNQPKPTLETTDVSQETAVTGDQPTATVTPIAKAKGKPVNILDLAASRESETLQSKMSLMGTVRQELAHAHDLFMGGQGQEAEATELADKAAVRLYQGRANGIIDGNEVSAVLGDIFGYVPKQDGTPGKTPAGAGGAIRKRIVRATQAAEYVNDGDGGRFFDGLPVEDISDIVESLNAGAITVWRAYDAFAEVKKEHSERVNMAFDPKRIAALAASLREEGAAATLAGSNALIVAYSELRDAMTDVAERAGAIVAKAA